MAETNDIRGADGPTGVPFITLDALRASSDAVLVDLRAPVEFDEDHLPGAVNAPLFEAETRSFVGLLYKQFSPDAAFNEARAAVLERVEGLVAEIAEAAGRPLPSDGLRERVAEMTSGGIARAEADLVPYDVGDAPARAVVLSCARGGLRSRSVVALLRAIGLEGAVGLEGGYRAVRKDAMDELGRFEPPPRVVVLRGLTGVGKTLLLHRLEALRPGSTLDLEALAAHRSSLLGMVGRAPRTQKAFEAGLAARLRAGFPDGVAFVEGESRKVGDVVIPVRVWEAMQGGVNVHVTASLARRVQVLEDDYLADEAALPKLDEQLRAVSARMEGAPPLAEMLAEGRVHELVELLLVRYYDPLYLGSEKGKEYAHTVDADDPDRAAADILAFSDGLARG
ncbi:MAG: tRNA 2-selenouridine(34) synthase MnmH [Planctomycetota bacterium]